MSVRRFFSFFLLEQISFLTTGSNCVFCYQTLKREGVGLGETVVCLRRCAYCLAPTAEADGLILSRPKAKIMHNSFPLGLGVYVHVHPSLGYYILMRQYNMLSNTGIPAAVVICACLITGAAFVVFLGEMGERKGIGSGISFILLVGIMSRIPSGITAPWVTALLLLGVAALMLLVILVNDAEERIPIQCAKRRVGRKLYGGHNTHLPIRVALAGVLPIIFAQALLSVFSTCFTLFGIPSEDSLLYGRYNFSTNQTWLYIFIYFLLIVGMTYYQCSVSFDPVKVSNSLRTAGASIPGYRPGKPTADLLRKVAHRVAFIAALYIAIVGILPMAVGKFVSLPVSIGGTSLIIVVGVILEFYKKLDAELSLYSYKSLF